MNSKTPIAQRSSLKQFGMLCLAAVVAGGAFTWFVPTPSYGLDTVTICWRGRTMVIAQGQQIHYPGYTTGACGTSPSL